LLEKNLILILAYFSSLADNARLKRIICSHKLYIHSLLPNLLRGGICYGRRGIKP